MAELTASADNSRALERRPFPHLSACNEDKLDSAGRTPPLVSVGLVRSLYRLLEFSQRAARSLVSAKLRWRPVAKVKIRLRG